MGWWRNFLAIFGVVFRFLKNRRRCVEYSVCLYFKKSGGLNPQEPLLYTLLTVFYEIIIFYSNFSNETFEFGCVQHTVPVKLLLKLESSLNFSPCGVAFVNKNIRTGILPSMLEEILETRLMVCGCTRTGRSDLPVRS